MKAFARFDDHLLAFLEMELKSGKEISIQAIDKETVIVLSAFNLLKK